MSHTSTFGTRPATWHSVDTRSSNQTINVVHDLLICAIGKMRCTLHNFTKFANFLPKPDLNPNPNASQIAQHILQIEYCAVSQIACNINISLYTHQQRIDLLIMHSEHVCKLWQPAS